MLTAALCLVVTAQPKILVFTKTAGFRHDSIPYAQAVVRRLGEKYGFEVSITEDSGAFTDENLKNFDGAAFILSTGDALNDEQQAAFERFIGKGKGFVGVHSATDTEYDWPFYGKLVGAYFESHPPGGYKAHVKVENNKFPMTKMIPQNWEHTDEWYNWRVNPRGTGVTILLSINEADYKDTPPQDHPIEWCRQNGKQRSWYTAMGHFKECWLDPIFQDHIAQGLLWAAHSSGKKQ